MQLPFRYQFLLAPATIILLLAGLVTYTLVELPRINRENEIPRQWELAADRALVMIATASHLDQVAQRMAATPAKRDELLFDYIEQTQIYLDNAQHSELLARAPEDIRRIIRDSTARLRDPEHVDPKVAHATLSTLLPALNQLYVGFQSQRRTALMDYHRNLREIVAQLINASLTVLLICIVLGVGLATWGLHATRRRLATLTQRAQLVCAGDLAPYPAPIHVRDELDTLDQCLAAMTQRLINTVAVEKVLQGAEDERRRIAMDMHDGVLAELTALSRTLDQAENAQAKTPPISELRANVAELAESIRCVIEDLHPQSLEILGLEAALRSFLARHGSSLPDYHFEFDPNAESALRPEQKIHLFRIATEAIHNVIRHAQCSRFEVSIRVVAQHLLCTVEDNGIGMPVAQMSQGHGCLNISERARAIGAQTSWGASRFSSGTRFEFSLPLVATPCPN
ncbi:MAG: ATP-binding protein [Burkholderiales bacterium]|nr:ATP-binding protein [Burkholderiales bacterium]